MKTTNIWDKRREGLEERLKLAALDLFHHMGTAGACKIPVPGTNPELFIVVGDNEDIKRFTD